MVFTEECNFCEYVESSREGLTAPALLRYITAFPQPVVLILLRKLLYMSLQSWTPGFCTDSGRNGNVLSVRHKQWKLRWQVKVHLIYLTANSNIFR